MASTYSNLKIQLMATGENSSTWGDVTNTNLGTAIEEAITGSADVAFSSANVTLTLTDTNATQSARNLRLNLTGTATAGYNLVVPAIEKAYIVNNGTDGTITVKNATGTGVAVPTGKTIWVFNNGTNVVDVVTHLTSLTLASALPVASGGTGGNTASAARTALGAAASGANTDITSLSSTGSFTLSSTGSLTLNPTTGTVVGSATGGVQGAGTINATGLFVNGAAVGVGSGSVTSVSGSGGSTGLTLTGGPITTSGTLTLGGTLAIANGGTGQTSASAALSALGGVPTSGSGATGTWSISISGTAATATTATTATTANATNASNNFQMNSLGVGTGGSGTAGEIRATNNVTAYYSSDSRLKENVQPINDALGIVSAIGGKTFDWTDAYIADHGGEDGYFVRKADFGVIAQDVEAVFPMAVRTREDGTLAVDYEKLVAVAFQAIAELRAEVEALKNGA